MHYLILLFLCGTLMIEAIELTSTLKYTIPHLLISSNSNRLIIISLLDERTNNETWMKTILEGLVRNENENENKNIVEISIYYYYLWNPSNEVFHHQPLFQELLLLMNHPSTAKIDFECVASFTSSVIYDSILFHYCSILRAIEQNADLIFITSSSTDIFFIPNESLSETLSEIAKEVEQRYDLEWDSFPLFVQSSLQQESLKEEEEVPMGLTRPSSDILVNNVEEASHKDGYCNLWWPLNHTELVILERFMNDFPVVQPFLLIIHCDFPASWLVQNPFINVSFIDYWNGDEIDCQQPCAETGKATFSTRNFYEEQSPDSIQQYRTRPISIHTFQKFYPSFNKQPTSRKKFEVILSIEDDNHVEIVSQFSIFQKIHSINTLPSPPHFVNINYNEYYYWLSYAKDRDYLGYIFSRLFQGKNTTFVEIGVDCGEFAETIVTAWKNLSMYIGIDIWKPWSYEEYPDMISTKETTEFDLNYEKTVTTLSKISSKTKKIILREDANKAVHLFVNESIDVVYIDAMHHYYAVLNDIKNWYPKVKVGGIIAGHDFSLDLNTPNIFTVKPAIEKFARDNQLTLITTSDRVNWMIVKTR